MRAANLAFAAWAAPPESARWRLVFAHEFEGATLDTLKRRKAGPLDYNVQIPLKGK